MPLSKPAKRPVNILKSVGINGFTITHGELQELGLGISTILLVQHEQPDYLSTSSMYI